MGGGGLSGAGITWTYAKEEMSHRVVSISRASRGLRRWRRLAHTGRPVVARLMAITITKNLITFGQVAARSNAKSTISHTKTKREDGGDVPIVTVPMRE